LPLMSKWLRTSLLTLFLLPGSSSCQEAASQGKQPNKMAEDSLELQLGKGYESLKQERYEDAEKAFRAALAIDPSMALRARFPFAVALFEQHKNQEARREFETVSRAAGERPSILYYLGRMDYEEQNYKSAAARLGKASAQPPYPDTAFYLGLAYLKLGSNDDAEKWLKKAMEVNPADTRAEYELAKLYRKAGREDEAKQAFQNTREKKVQSDKLSQLKYQCGQELGRGLNEAAPSCDQLDDPNDADVLTALGVLYGEHGQLEKALKPLQRAAELSPQSPQIQYNLAYTYVQLRRFEEARTPLESAVKRWPDLFPLNALYGAVLWNTGEPQAAYEALHHAHQLNSQDAATTDLLYQSVMEMAARSEKAGADSDALRYLQEAATLAPADPTPHQRLAAIHRRAGRISQAGAEEKKAAELLKSSTR